MRFFNQNNSSYAETGEAFSINGTQYPPNWIEHASEEDIAALGFIPVVTIGERGDDRYFDNAETTFGAIHTITATPKDLGTLRAIQWEAIKAERDRRIQHGGYKVGDKWYHSDTFSRTQQIGLVMLGANIPPGTPWKTMDGSTIEMTPSIAALVFAAAAASDIAIFSAAETHRAAMEASSTPADYDFSTCWPAIFGE